MAEDEDLLNSIGEGDGESVGSDTPEKESESKKKKSAKPKSEPAKPSNQLDKLDPRDEFLEILADIGIKRGVGVITDVFFNGDVSDPQYLDNTLSLGGISVPQRRLIITRYFGQTPEELEVEMVTTAQSRKVKQDSAYNSDDLGVTAAQMMKDRLQAAQTKALINQLNDYGNEGNRDMPRKVVKRPLVDPDTGDFIMKDGKPVMEEIETIGGEPVQTSDPMTMMVAMANILGKKGESGDRPSWAMELMNQVNTSKAESEKQRLEDELRRERDKREDDEKEHRRDMERMKDDMAREVSHIKDGHVEEMKRISDDLSSRMENIKGSFDAELRHRDEMDSLKDVYGAEFGKLHDEIDTMHKDVKSAVVGEAVKTGSKVVGKSTDTIDTVVGGAAEVFKDMYKAQIEAMRGNIGVGGNMGVPDTTERELEELL